MECYIDVDTGTLYYAVRRLERAGLIAAVRQEKVTRGGRRTVYRIRARGRKYFQQLLLAQLAAPGTVAQTLYPALLFLHLADLPAAARALREREASVSQSLRELDALGPQMRPVLSTGGQLLITHLRRQRQLDLRWLREALETIESGQVEDVPDPGRLARHRG